VAIISKQPVVEGPDLAESELRMLQAKLRLAEHWSSIGHVVYAVLPPHAPSRFTSVTQRGSIGISFTAHRRAARQYDGGPIHDSDIQRGDAFLTSSADLHWLKVAEPADALEFHLSAAYVQAVADDLGTSRGAFLRDVGGTFDPVIWAIASMFRANLRRAAPIGDLRASELLHALTAHVLFRYAGVVHKEKHPGKLDARRLRRVVEYIDQHLAEHLTLETLARAASLSAYHFAHSFRATTMLTPHGFVTARRMDKARQLLVRTTFATSAIANSVGYTNVAHFRENFVRWFGATPARFRMVSLNTSSDRESRPEL
jgi:AraC family transcriptional regulator